MMLKLFVTTLKKTKLGLYLRLDIRINSVWLRDLNAKIKIMQVLEENMGIFLFNLSVTKGFLTIP